MTKMNSIKKHKRKSFKDKNLSDSFVSKYTTTIYTCVFLILCYLPILIMISLSFSSGNSVGNFGDFSFKWYGELFKDASFMASILVSIIVSFTATFFALIIGTLTAIGLSRNSNKVVSRYFSSVTNYPIFAAEIVLGISLMVVFITFGLPFGMGTLIFAHIVFITPYVIISVLPRLKSLDPSLIDASFDLGAKPAKALTSVILPNIKTAMFVGGSIAFAISFDDFIISYLTSGSVENVSTHIYSIKRITPIVYAFGTILVLFISSVFIIKFLIDYRNDKQKNWKEYFMIKQHNKLVEIELNKIVLGLNNSISYFEKIKLRRILTNDYDIKVKSISYTNDLLRQMGENND